jgi:hypothetical protein
MGCHPGSPPGGAPADPAPEVGGLADREEPAIAPAGNRGPGARGSDVPSAPAAASSPPAPGRRSQPKGLATTAEPAPMTKAARSADAFMARLWPRLPVAAVASEAMAVVRSAEGVERGDFCTGRGPSSLSATVV